jgi:hypothetical protein
MPKNSKIMVYHILNGDSLAHSFPDSKIEGDIIVAREGLIEGDLSGKDLQELWRTRANYMEISEAGYHDKVVREFEKVINSPDNNEFNLWFEYDLFCQVNMWFTIYIIKSLPVKKKVYAVYTSYLDRNHKHFWNGFGHANSDELKICFADRIPLNDVDIQLGHDLWNTYKSNNLEDLIRIAESQTLAFPYLQEVVKAHIDRFPKDETKGKPERVIEDIMQSGSTEFHEVFKEFWERESIYGFGDTQFKHLFDKVMHS